MSKCIISPDILARLRDHKNMTDQDFVTFVGSIFEKYQEKLNEDDGMDSLLEYLGVKSESLEDSEDFLDVHAIVIVALLKG